MPAVVRIFFCLSDELFRLVDPKIRVHLRVYDDYRWTRLDGGHRKGEERGRWDGWKEEKESKEGQDLLGEEATS